MVVLHTASDRYNLRGGHHFTCEARRICPPTNTELFVTKRLQGAFQLGDWLVEPDLNRLSRDSEAVTLEPKTMAVLVNLCDHPDEVVSADEIINAVWGGRPMGDNPVYKAVAKLRRALGDDSGEPRYIATIAKKGYRLMADVSPAIRAVGQQAEARQPSRWRRSVFPVATGMLIGLVIAAAVFWRPQPDLITFRPVSEFAGSHIQPSFSPDGQSIVYVSESEEGRHLWVLGFDNPKPRQLTRGNVQDLRPRWSPDGNLILFMRDGSLWTIASAGGEPVEIVRNAYNPNWSHDSKRIVFERRYEVWTANSDGAQQARVQGIPRQELPLAPRWPAFSPSGDEIAYLDANRTAFADVWRIPVGGGNPARLTFDPAFASAPVWSPDGKYIVYSSQRGGSRTLWRVDIDGGTSKPLLSGSGDDDFPDISADGKQLVYSNRRERFAVTLSDPEADTHRTLHESRHMILGPELSPDRSGLAFFAMARDGGMQLFTMSLFDAAPKQITFDPLATHAIPRWSADGQFLYFYFVGDAVSFAKVHVSSGEAEPIVPDWDWDVANGASVSPDETQIAYSRLMGQVPVQTAIRQLHTGKDEAFYATLEYPRWSRDGTSIVGALHVDQRFPGDIAQCPVAGPECRIIARSARIPMFSPDEIRIFYVRGIGATQDLFVSSLAEESDEKKLMTMAPLFPLGPFYDITEDGKVVWVRYEQEASDIWLAQLSN